MFDIFKNRLEISGILWTVTALRISAGRSVEPIGSDLPVIKDALGQPLIPGSSFKGALRSRLESFLRGVLGDNRHLVANPANENEWSITSSEIRSLKDSFPSDYDLTEQIINKTDTISLLFGSPWLASKFQVRDLTVHDPENYWFGQYQERDGVSIDRDTETAADGKLYDFQVVPPSTPFEFKAIVENAEPWQLGMLAIGLHQFETEQVPLGGGRSRGLGVVRLEDLSLRWVDTTNNPEALLEYLQKLVQGDQSALSTVDQAQKDEWVQAFISHLKSVRQTATNTAA
jgi:CRISPR-associated RAMP protein (TIGR02581 family)